MIKRVKLRQPSPRYGNFSTFQDGGHRHLGFLKSRIFKGQEGQQGQNFAAIGQAAVEM